MGNSTQPQGLVGPRRRRYDSRHAEPSPCPLLPHPARRRCAARPGSAVHPRRYAPWQQHAQPRLVGRHLLRPPRAHQSRRQHCPGLERDRLPDHRKTAGNAGRSPGSHGSGQHHPGGPPGALAPRRQRSCRRFLVWAILGRYGYWPNRWPIGPCPSHPEYAPLIVRYRNGDRNALLQDLVARVRNR